MRRQIPKMDMLLSFEAAAKRESFTKAAEDMHLTQGAISRQVIALEHMVGHKLFERANGRLFLNDMGRRLYGELVPMLDGLDSLFLTIRDQKTDISEITITTYPTLAARWFIAKKLAFEADFPAYNMRVVTVQSNADVDWSLTDLAILQGQAPWTDLTADFLMDEELVIVGSPEFVARQKQRDIVSLGSLPHLRHLNRPMSFQIWSDMAGEGAVIKGKTTVFERFDMMIEAALAGHGLGIFPKILVERELSSGLLVQAHPFVANPVPAYFILAPHRDDISERVQDFRNWILNEKSP